MAHDPHDTNRFGPAWTCCDIPGCSKPGVIKYDAIPMVSSDPAIRNRLISAHLCNEHIHIPLEEAVVAVAAYRALRATPPRDESISVLASATQTLTVSPDQDVTIQAGQGVGGAPQGNVSIEGAHVTLVGSVFIDGSLVVNGASIT